MKIWQYLWPKYWTRISQIHPKSDNTRRDTLFAQIMVVGTLISLLHFFNDLIRGNSIAYIIDLTFIIILVLLYVINEKGWHRVAKIFDLGLLNILIFLLAGVLDERTRMVYNFFPMAILAFIVFYKSELMLSIVFAALPMVLVLILEFTDYRPFGDMEIKEGVDVVTLGINVLGSFVLLVMGLLFLIRLNDLVEKEQLVTEKDLRKTNKELDRFVYSASHDLRAPLRSVMGLTNLMKREENNQNMLGYIDMVNQRVTDLDRFVGDIIDHSRNSRMAIVREVVDFDKLIDNVFAKLKYIEGADQISLIKALKIHEFATDSSRLTVILTNMMSNAIKYADVEKPEQWIKVSSEHKASSIVLTIEDNGIGIDDTHRGQIFEMFYRASDRSDGSGLGLYIVHEAVHKLKGTISVSSSLKNGTKFTITFPGH